MLKIIESAFMLFFFKNCILKLALSLETHPGCFQLDTGTFRHHQYCLDTEYTRTLLELLPVKMSTCWKKYIATNSDWNYVLNVKAIMHIRM